MIRGDQRKGPVNILTLQFCGWDPGMVSASLQLHMKDRSGPSVMPRGPAINNEGRRELGKSILEKMHRMSRTPSLGV